ncbi:nuclear transport factor 2 family protein [Conexibacter sp. CPCC 206217]|uniref:nuclear transport factor 2 family protein n=1 Tax=Conexibacter sp. CPCC 206217 TaxID=3064574 RepID=UPI00271A8092|nr:nuclear transport factor 2 family protein [Conexibacter sp. CPCC 206217]MDO8210170.1 nuclear transport factor 2 family protein [Conexibacter sp. CPCC 206217]
MAIDRSEGEALFRLLEQPETAAAFFERVADDVRWTVMGTHPISGTYTDKARFAAATFDRLRAVMRDGIHLTLTSLFVDGDTVIAEMRARSTTLEGAPYDNTLCWVCRIDGDRIVEVRAYLDSAMVTWTVERNEPRDRTA